MYEVLDIPKMMKVKASHIRNRSRIPVRSNGNANTKVKWGGLILVKAGLSKEQFRLIPAGSELKHCIQDRSVWEIYIPAEFKKSKKLLAKRLDAIAFM
jgi:hypothetical protein